MHVKLFPNFTRHHLITHTNESSLAELLHGVIYMYFLGLYNKKFGTFVIFFFFYIGLFMRDLRRSNCDHDKMKL